MGFRGLSGGIFPRALTALIVAFLTTAAALHVFFATAFPPDSDTPQALAGAGNPDSYAELTEVAQPAPPSLTIRTDLEQTATIAGYLTQAGLSRRDAEVWADHFEDAAQSTLIRKGHPVTIYKDPETGALTGFKYDIDDHEQILEASLGQGIVKAFHQPIRYTVRPVSLAFEVKGESFHDTAIKNRLPSSVLDGLEDAFSGRFNLDHLAPGTAVKLIYEEQISRDGVHRIAGDIDAAEIRYGTHTTKAYAFRDEHGRAHLYDEEGHALGQQFLRFPLNFQYISSGYTLHRYHPILHQYRPHLGVDLAAKYGTPVKAIADGRVESSGWCGELGNCIRIEHENSTVSIYGHLSKIDMQATRGTYIKMGQVIGNVGSTGLSTGPHLHFAIEKRGAIINPLTQTLGVHHQVSPRMHALFENFKSHYQLALAKLPNLGSHFAVALDRKPAISPLADQYHVTVTSHLVPKAVVRHNRRHQVEAGVEVYRDFNTADAGTASRL